MSVRIEFTEKTDKRQEGEVVSVDENSAAYFVDVAKVAKYADVDEPAAEPEPSPVVVDEPAPTAPADPPPIQTVDGFVVDEGVTPPATEKPAPKPRGA